MTLWTVDKVSFRDNISSQGRLVGSLATTNAANQKRLFHGFP